MGKSKENQRLVQFILITVVSVPLAILVIYFYLSGKEKKLIERSKQECIVKARLLTGEIEANLPEYYFTLLNDERTLTYDSSLIVDDRLAEIIGRNLTNAPGLEGGVYIASLDRFMGYAFPTSPPPVPEYGPPPRSYHFIRRQAQASVSSGTEIINVHAFDPAVFPLATMPLYYRDKPVGAVWVRIHVERELPVAKLKRIINIVTVLSLFGFLVMAMYSYFLRNGIRNIRLELDNTSTDPSYRLRRRGGWFAFIPASINVMLDTLQKDDRERKELEKQLHQKEKLASLGKMVAGVAHELKTPLSVVKTRIQMWERIILESNEMKQKISPDSIKLVLDEIDRLSGLMKRLVIFARPIYENLKPVEPDRLIEEVLSMTDTAVSGKTIRILFSPGCGGVLINADANSIKQVLINLLNNSIEAIDEDGEIHISTVYLENERRVRLEIDVTGKGIPEDMLNRLFEPFSTSKEFGTGLGLAIAYEIVTAHSGTIIFNNREGEGALCIITLPENKI